MKWEIYIPEQGSLYIENEEIVLESYIDDYDYLMRKFKDLKFFNPLIRVREACDEN